MNIDYIVIHCTATEAGKDFTAADIDKWHKARGFRKIGYHYVVRLNGSLETGRAESEVGAHTIGLNANSLGVVYVGGLENGKPKDTRTGVQRLALENLIKELLQDYPQAQVAGHYDFAPKACPCFNVFDWCKNVGIPDKNIHKK